MKFCFSLSLTFENLIIPIFIISIVRLKSPPLPLAAISRFAGIFSTLIINLFVKIAIHIDLDI